MNAVRRWNKLRQAVKVNSQRRRNVRAADSALLAFVRKLDKATEKAQRDRNSQLNRLRREAEAMNALRDPNYVNARFAVIKIHKKHLAKLKNARNKVVNDLVRNSISSQIRKNLFAEGIKRGTHGTSQNNWQNWTNKLWHSTRK